VFQLLEAKQTPLEAFKSLYPPMDFDSPNSWTSGRKADIIRSLTPIISLDVKKCNMVISNMRKRQFDVVEERAQATGGSRLLNAVNAGAQRQKKCTLRLGSASEASEWVSLLERTKKALGSMNSSKPTRFGFNR
jgi:hypothetical protein